MNIGGLRPVVMRMVLVSALTAALIFALQIGVDRQANATQGVSYTGHLSIGACTAACSVPVPGSNFTVDINLDTWPAAYSSFEIVLNGTTGICIGANTAAMAASWPHRIEYSSCISTTQGDAAAGEGFGGSPATQKGKIGEVTFKCSQSGTISLGSDSFIEVGSAGNEQVITIGDLHVICASSGPTATPTITPTPTPTPQFGNAYTGHVSIGSCTAACSAPANTTFVASLNIDTIPAPYDGFQLDIGSATGTCKSANEQAARVFWPNLIPLSGCVDTNEGEVAASKSPSDTPSTYRGKVGEIVFNCSQDGTLSPGTIFFVVNASTGASDPITFPNLQVTCKPATATPTPTLTPTPAPPVGGVSIDPVVPGGAAGRQIGVMIGIAAAGVVAMGGAAWYLWKPRTGRWHD